MHVGVGMVCYDLKGDGRNGVGEGPREVSEVWKLHYGEASRKIYRSLEWVRPGSKVCYFSGSILDR